METRKYFWFSWLHSWKIRSLPASSKWPFDSPNGDHLSPEKVWVQTRSLWRPPKTELGDPFWPKKHILTQQCVKFETLPGVQCVSGEVGIPRISGFSIQVLISFEAHVGYNISSLVQTWCIQKISRMQRVNATRNSLGVSTEKGWLENLSTHHHQTAFQLPTPEGDPEAAAVPLVANCKLLLHGQFVL